MLKRFSLMVLAAVIAATLGAHAAGPRPDKEPESRDAREIAKCAEWIKEGKYGRSIRVLSEVVERDPTNADAYNLLGYAHRKVGKLDDSAHYYERALAIDPDHKGALEYQGELFLMQDKLADAKANLEHLEKLCPEDCEEREDLAEAIAAHEEGKKPRPKGRW